MKESEINALITLLEDPDKDIFTLVADRLVALGPDIVPALEKAWEKPVDDLQQVRIENILTHIQSSQAIQGLQGWINNPYHHNLLEGAYWVARQSYPYLQLEDLMEEVNEIIYKELWPALTDEMGPEEKIKTLNYYFFQQHRFGVPADDVLLPRHNYINNVIESHQGNVIALNLLYMHIAQTAGIPLQAICLPRNFILAYVHDDNQVLFYVNAFQQGMFLYKKDLNLYFRRLNMAPREDYFRPRNNIVTIQRLLEMQIYSYEREGNEEKAENFRALLPLFGTEKTYFTEEEPE